MTAMSRRSGTLAAALVVIAALATGCDTSHSASRATQSPATHLDRSAAAGKTTRVRPKPLTATERRTAIVVARREIAKQAGAKIASASAVVRAGIITDSNSGTKCLSGRLLRIKLIGTFPRIVVLPPAGATGSNSVHARIVIADVASGRACLVSVQTGKVSPQPGATMLNLAIT